MRYSVIHRQLNDLRVDKYHPDIFWRCFTQNAHKDRVYAHGLTGTGRTGNKKVRHLGDITVDRLTGDVLTESDVHRIRLPEFFGLENSSQVNG